MARFFKKIICPLLYAFAAFALFSQETLNLEKAVELALGASIALQKDAADLELARIKAASVWAEFFPTINARGGFSWDIPLDSRKTSPELSASVSLELNLNAGLPFAIRNAGLAWKNALLKHEKLRSDLILDITKRFYSLLAQKNELDVLEGAFILANDQMERDKTAWNSGYLGELDYLQSRLSAENARLSHSLALSAYRSSLADFLVMLGLDQRIADEQGLTLEGTISAGRLDAGIEDLMLERLPLRPDLMAARNEIERLKNLYAQNLLSTRAPQLSLSGSWGLDSAGGPDRKIAAGIGIVIPIDPLIPRTKRNMTARETETELEKARLDVKEKENAARSEIRSAAANLDNAWNGVLISSLNVDIAGRAFELSREGYQRGTVNFLDFEKARNSLTAARQQKLQSELDYVLLVLDLAYALNMSEDELRSRK